MVRARAVLLAVAVLSGCGSAERPESPQASVAAPSSAVTESAATESARPRRSVAPRPSALTSAAATVTFRVAVAGIDDRLARRMRSSWRPGCPVPLSELRYVRLGHWGFDRRPRIGELVVHRDAVSPITAAFRALFAQRFPIRQVRLVDDYAGSDDASVAADNTSAFNCRFVSGTTRWSEHAYGRAIDVNPFENPYVRGGAVSPPPAAPYADRTRLRPGMLTAAAVAAFTAQGWQWGGHWRTAKDYQHFSATGR